MKPPAASRQPPAASRQPPAASRDHDDFFEWVVKFFFGF
jgi:hypothetical protein